VKAFVVAFWSYLAVFLPKLGASVLVFVGFWMGGMLASAVIRRVARRAGPDREPILELGAQCAKIGLRIFGAITALGTLGVDVSALVAGLGLTGFALGFALRDALSNVLAGMMILFYRPFRRGARISVAGLQGTVTDIDLRYTSLVASGQCILIPNSNLLTNPITVHEPEEIVREQKGKAPGAGQAIAT
jgi:small-conductance mechanosensitive channel